MGFEPILPEKRNLSQKQDIYQWSDPKDGYPPHLATLPDDQSQSKLGPLFNESELDKTTTISKAFSFLIPLVSILKNSALESQH